MIQKLTSGLNGAKYIHRCFMYENVVPEFPIEMQYSLYYIYESLGEDFTT